MASTEPAPPPLQGVRICDLSGLLAGAGATRLLAALGAEVIRVEDPVRQGRWDGLRGLDPFIDERRGNNLGGAFNNHNVQKLGITINLKDPRGKDLLRRLIAISDAVTENFTAQVMEKLGFGYDQLREINPGIIYVSNCGFGHTGPYRDFRSYGPIVQAMSGQTFASGLPGLKPAGWGYSYMDHHGGYFGALAVLVGLMARRRTGEGQWIDISCTEAALSLLGTDLLESSVNGRRFRDDPDRNSNRSASPPMAPHGIYRCAGEDNWIAIACRDDVEWKVVAAAIGPEAEADDRFQCLDGRLHHFDALDDAVNRWTRSCDHGRLARMLRAAGVPASVVARPRDRIDNDRSNAEWNLWPVVSHQEMGDVRVDGLPFHLSRTDWRLTDGAPCLGEDNDHVLGTLLGLDSGEIDELRTAGVV